MDIRGVLGNQSYYTSGPIRNGSGSSMECKSVYEADPSAVIRKEEDGIVAKSQYTEEEALWNQYMKQYRDSLKIVDGTIFLTSQNIHLAHVGVAHNFHHGQPFRKFHCSQLRLSIVGLDKEQGGIIVHHLYLAADVLPAQDNTGLWSAFHAGLHTVQ